MMTTGLTKLEGPVWSHSLPRAEEERGPKEMNVTPSSVAGNRQENTQLNLMTYTSSVKVKHKEIRVMRVF